MARKGAAKKGAAKKGVVRKGNLTPAQRNAGRPIARATVAKMREAYVRNPNCSEIARDFGYNPKTIQALARTDRWAEYADRVRVKIDELAVNKSAQAQVRDLTIVQTAIARMGLNLAGRPQITFSPVGLDKLIRLERFIEGGADGRIDHTGGRIVIHLPDNERDGVTDDPDERDKNERGN